MASFQSRVSMKLIALLNSSNSMIREYLLNHHNACATYYGNKQQLLLRCFDPICLIFLFIRYLTAPSQDPSPLMMSNLEILQNIVHNENTTATQNYTSVLWNWERQQMKIHDCKFYFYNFRYLLFLELTDFKKNLIGTCTKINVHAGYTLLWGYWFWDDVIDQHSKVQTYEESTKRGKKTTILAKFIHNVLGTSYEANWNKL